MQVLKITPKSGYAFSTSKFFEFGRFAKDCGNFVFLEGGFEKDKQWEQWELSPEELTKLKKKKLVIMELEEPNKYFVGDNPEDYEADFYRIFSICPYTTEWINKKNHYKKRVFTFYPFNEKHIPKKQPKTIDVIYAGHIVSHHLEQDLKAMTPFKYRLISRSKSPMVTDSDADNKTKMNLIAQSKISLVHNLLYPKPYHFPNIWRVPGYQDNEAFKMVPHWTQPWKFFNPIFVPQLKARVFEAAVSRSLILCRRDEFNVIEHFFEPGKEFLYYEPENLEATIRKILRNYKKYEPIVERAYKRATKEYTTKAFAEKYLRVLK
jgi:hypothetical protein